MVTVARLIGPGGARSIVAENLLLKQQLLILSRTRSRAPRLSVTDRFLFGLWSLFLTPQRILQTAILKPSTLMRFRAALIKRKYHQLFTPAKRAKPGPKGPSQALIQAIVEIKSTFRPLYMNYSEY